MVNDIDFWFIILLFVIVGVVMKVYSEIDVYIFCIIVNFFMFGVVNKNRWDLSVLVFKCNRGFYFVEKEFWSKMIFRICLVE